MADFTTIVSDLQGLFATAILTTFALIFKLILLGVAVQVVTLFLPRYLRPLVALGALALVLAFPTALSAAGDAILARAGLLPQAGAFTPAGVFPAATAGIAAQAQATLDSFTAFLTSQLGL